MFFSKSTAYGKTAGFGTGIFRPVFFTVLLLCLFPVFLSAQESILSSYERNFIRASLADKSRILKDAATDERSGEFIGALYELAIRFALTNGDIFRGDPDMISLVGISARGAGASGNRGSANSLWELLQIYNDSYSGVEILGALAILGKENPELIGNLNKFLENQNNSFRAGVLLDYPVLRACIAALGALGDSSSFPVLFSSMTAGYPQAVSQEILAALESIQGDYRDYLTGIIRNNPFQEKAAAFRIGAYNEKFTAAERGEIARITLEIALGFSGPAESSLRYDAVTALTRLRWTPAAALAIRNFYRVQSDYSSGFAPKERLIEAIACLGVMESTEAAQALALQLGYLNSRTEQSGHYDEAVMVALINALGELGDKAAFDYLLYISYLNYPDRIQASAREALNRLKW